MLEGFLTPEFETGWLVRDGAVLASVERAVNRGAKVKGVMGRDSLEGAMLLPGVRSVHSFSLKWELDVAFLNGDGCVIRTLRLHRNRMTLPVWRARSVLEAEAGAFARWDLKVDDELEFRSGPNDVGSLDRQSE